MWYIEPDRHDKEGCAFKRRSAVVEESQRAVVVDQMECYRKVTWEMRLEKSLWP